MSSSLVHISPHMMSHSCIPLYSLLLLRTPGASSEMHPEPAGYCRKYADEVGCRERHSGGLQCRDPSKCKGGGSSCSDADAARRVGMTCAGFPWWNGGWPLSALHWDKERESYECDTTASPSGTSDYCSQWITIEDSADEWAIVCASARRSAMTPSSRTVPFGAASRWRWKSAQACQAIVGWSE